MDWSRCSGLGAQVFENAALNDAQQCLTIISRVRIAAALRPGGGTGNRFFLLQAGYAVAGIDRKP